MIFLFLSTFAQKILLEDIPTLTFYENQYTTSRRAKAIKQLKMIGGNAPKKYRPHVVQCQNMGWDGRQVNWKCKANLNQKVSFGETTVSCEGYKNSKDRHVLAGSCGLEYTLYLGHTNQDDSSSDFDYSWIIIIVWLSIIIYVFSKPSQRAARPEHPPPPYSEFDSRNNPESQSSWYSFFNWSPRPRKSTDSWTWIPSFLRPTSFFQGFLAGNLFNSFWNRSATSNQEQHSPRNRSSSPEMTQRTYAGTRLRNPTFNAPSSPSASSSSDNDYVATGFGGTRNR